MAASLVYAGPVDCLSLTRHSCAPRQTLRRPSSQLLGAISARRPAPAAGAPAPGQGPVRQQARRAATLVTRAKRATEADEKLIEEMKAAADKGDLWEGGVAGAAVAVLAVTLAVAFVVVIGFAGEPIVENTVNSFPTAAQLQGV